MEGISVFLVDDHEVILDSLAMMLSSLKGIRVVGKATNGQEALEKIQTGLLADVMLSDMHMPGINGVELALRIREKHPDIRFILLTMEEESAVVHAAQQAGICGYVLKKASKSELELALRTVAEGKKYYMLKAAPELFDLSTLSQQASSPVFDALSKREIQIIRLIVNEVPGTEIARQLYISPKTVETHRRNIFRKLDIHSAVALTRFAIQHRLI